mgnify:CR=1 FL=1
MAIKKATRKSQKNTVKKTTKKKIVDKSKIKKSAKKKTQTKKVAAKKNIKKLAKKKSIKSKTTQSTSKKSVRKKAVKKSVVKKTVKKPAKKKVAKPSVKKPVKKKVAKQSTKKIVKKTSSKKTASKAIKKKLQKKSTKKNSESISVKKVIKSASTNRPPSKKKHTTTKKPGITSKKPPKLEKKSTHHGKQSSKAGVSLTEVNLESKKEKPRMIPEDIHPPTMPVDTSPEEFTTPDDLRTTAGAVEFSPYKEVANETYMNENQKQHFHDILSKWKNQLMSEVDSTVGHMKQEALSLPDPLDRATQEEGFNLELRTRDRERKLIKKIEQSLDDIDKGVYGYCEECGVDIGIRRLEARPTADKCIDCKTFSEIRERQEGLS